LPTCNDPEGCMPLNTLFKNLPQNASKNKYGFQFR